MTTTNMIYAEAVKHTAEARAEYEAAEAYSESLSQGEHPDALEDADDRADYLFGVYNDARAVELRAYTVYTNPFGVSKTVDARWPKVGLDPALTLG